MFSDDTICTVAIKMAFPYKPVLVRRVIDAVGRASAFYNLNRVGREEVISNNSTKSVGESHQFPDFDLWYSKAEEEVKWCISKGINVTCIGDKEYPSCLLDIPDPPVVLFTYGNHELKFEKSIAIVGTRKPSRYGLDITGSIIEDIASADSSAIVVSGLAFGIDITAHVKALEVGLPTVAILPGAMDNIYPATHRGEASKIAKKGLLISDFTRNSESYKINFINRNRIIAAITRATILVESGLRGGGLITARFASSYNRDVFAVPGRCSDNLSQGCNSLISENVAMLYFNTREFFRQTGWELPSNGVQQTKLAMEVEGGVKQKILVSLSNVSDLSTDEMANLTKLPPSSLAVHLLELELERKIVGFAGNRYRINRFR